MTHTLTRRAALAALGFAFALNLAAEQTGPGRHFLAGDDSTRRLAIIAPDGSIEWETKLGAIHDAWVLPNGNLLLQQGWTKIIELSPDKQAVWEYDSAKMNGNEGKRGEVHAFQRVENGLTMIAESGPGRIIEVDNDGQDSTRGEAQAEQAQRAQRHAARPQNRHRQLPRRARGRRLRPRV